MNEIVTVVAATPWLHWSILIVLGLILGSFLGCATYRLPIMMQQGWQQSARDMLNITDEDEEKKINLFYPPSFCPHCRRRIGYLFLIPVIGYLLARAKCTRCNQRISPLYPLLEIATAILLCWIWLGDSGASALLASVYALALLALAVIDAKHQLLPDSITQPLLWLGLLANAWGLYVPWQESFFGAVLGYGFFWLLYWVFYLCTGRESLGMGDMKLLAVLAAWAGVWSLPAIILFASTAGLLWLLIRRLLNRGAVTSPMAFAPFLIVPGWALFMFGDDWLVNTSLFLDALY